MKNRMKLVVLIFLLNIYYTRCSLEEGYCDSQTPECNEEREKSRYLFYDVNSAEGFNLRRDVYVRFAVLAHHLKNSDNDRLKHFKLVLPPWPNLFHWNMKQRVQIPWAEFFDLNSLQKFAPVIEMHQFFKEEGVQFMKFSNKIDEVYILQHFEDMFETGVFVDKMRIAKCNKEYKPAFYQYLNVSSDNIRCLSFHGPITLLTRLLDRSTAKSILIDHGEVALHENFGNNLYWQARRSMRFDKRLQKVALDFCQKYLDSPEELDGIELPDDWRAEQPNRQPSGGNYLAVHLRRGDFAVSRSNDVPNIASAAIQIMMLLDKVGTDKVFIASDCSELEYQKLKDLLLSDFKMYRYIPDPEDFRQFRKGKAAIVDQIICSRAKYFVGTHESTFSFRIQEEREIMNFPPNTTFNCLCKTPTEKCEQPTRWRIVY